MVVKGTAHTGAEEIRTKITVVIILAGFDLGRFRSHHGAAPPLVSFLNAGQIASQFVVESDVPVGIKRGIRREIACAKGGIMETVTTMSSTLAVLCGGRE